MRIVHVSSSVFGGAGLAAFRLHSTMLKNNIESVFLSKTYENERLSCIKVNQDKSNDFYNRAINYILNRINKFINKKYDSFNFEYHSNIRTNYRVDKNCIKEDIIILHWVADFLDYKSFFNNIDKDSKIFIYVHDFNCIQGKLHTLFDKRKIDQKPLQIIETFYRKKKMSYYNKINNLKIIANSNYTYNVLNKSEFFPKASLYQINLGLPINELKPIDKKIAKSEQGFAKEDFIILFSANNLDSELKGFDRLLTIFNEFKTHSKFKFIGLGKTHCKSLLDQENFFNFNTWDPSEKSRLFSAADVTLSTSYEETFGQTIIESYACSTPVIVYNNAALPELVDHYKTGFIAKNENEVVNFLKLLFTNSLLKDKFIKNVREVFLKNYTSENQLRKIQKILN